MTELSLLPTNDLVDELIKRHDAIVLTGIKYTKMNGEYLTFRKYSGNRLVCSGLINVVNDMLVNDERNQTISIREGDI